jgi:hypothetical protein
MASCFSRHTLRFLLLTLILSCGPVASKQPEQTVEHPYAGITLISRSMGPPALSRTVNLRVLQIDLADPGIRFKLSPPGGSLEVITQKTLDYLINERAQFAVNVHFFLPVGPPEVNLIGLAASDGAVYSGFEIPAQSYAIVDYAPALNIDPENHASIVHPDLRSPDGKNVVEKVKLWNAVSGSAQIVANGAKTIPVYRDASHPEGLLTPGKHYSNDPAQGESLGSWYEVPNPRTAIGLSRDNRILTLFTADGRGAGGSWGLTGSEMADILIRDYSVYNALNLDGGGSTTLAMKDPATGMPVTINTPSDNPARPVGSNLAIFAAPIK